MKKLLNTLYITRPNAYLRLDGENIVIEEDGNVLGKLPLINFESIVYFGYPGISPKLLGYCADKNIPICFLTKNGKFLARVNGEYHGNIILRKTQYLISEDKKQSASIARNFIFGKVALLPSDCLLAPCFLSSFQSWIDSWVCIIIAS